jgi:hypothetical protein
VKELSDGVGVAVVNGVDIGTGLLLPEVLAGISVYV